MAGDRGRKMAALLWGIFIFLISPLQAAAFPLEMNLTKVNKTVRVAVYTQCGSDIYYKNKEPGYLTDYLDRLSYYAETKKNINLTFEYVPAESVAEMERLLGTGEADIAQVVVYGKGYDGNLKLGGRGTGEALYSLCTQKEDRRFYYEDPEQLNGECIGAIRGSGGIELLEQYALDNRVTYELKLYADSTELEGALEKGDISAAVTVSGSPEVCRIIARLGKTQVYFGAAKNKSNDVLRLVEELQELLYTYEPYYDSKLADLYFPNRREMYEAYSREEAAYVREMSPIRIAVRTDDRPNCYYDGKQERFAGTYIELLDLMAGYSGLKFEYVPVDSRAESLLAVKEGRADAILGLYKLRGLEESWDFSSTSPLLSKYIVVVGSDRVPDEKVSQTVAISMDRAEEWTAYIREFFPDWDERFFSSEEECFRQVSKGAVNFALADGNSIQFDNLYSRSKGVGTVTSLSKEVDVVIGYPRNMPMIEQAVIDKAVQSLSTPEIISCQMNNAFSSEESMLSLLREFLPYIVAALLVIVTAFVSLLAVSSHRKRYADQRNAFFSNMSHEIRTPLNGVIGMTNIAQKNIDNPERLQDCLNKIDASCGHLLVIVNDILDLSKLEKGKMRVAHERMELGELLHTLHAVYFAQAREKGIDYETVADGVKTEIVLGDYTRLSQVLMNLLSNAVKFTPAGRKIRFTVTEIEGGGENVRYLFSVKDEGMGIPRENLSRIFSAYEQQGAKTAGKYGGSGLGLPISKELVKLMGGSLKVKSEPGKGSEFYFSVSLPVVEKEAVIPEEKGTNILLVEDEESAGRIVESQMTALGLRCVSVMSREAAGTAARESAEGRKFAVCFIDWDKAEREAAQALLAQRASGGFKIVAYSADARRMQEEYAADIYLEKPIMRSDICKALRELRSGGRVEGELKRKVTETPFFPGGRILIAEDNEVNMEILCELTGTTGCRIDQAVNGREAVEMFADSEPGSYDLIFMDIQMPEMNGYEAAKAIRALPRKDAATVPILAMTADAFDSDVEHSIKAGMNRHLSKPVNVGELYAAMYEFMGPK